MKIVEFELYCSKCKHYNSSDADDPCDYCLSVPARENSRRPIKYEENKKNVKKKGSNYYERKHYEKL